MTNSCESNYVYEGQIVNLRLDKIKLGSSNEKKHLREVVEHNPAVAILPIDDHGNIFFVRQYRHPTKENLLEVPAGIIEEEEHPADTAMRELQEEIGYASANLRPLGGFWSSPGFTDEYIHCFKATSLVKSKLPEDEDEDITVEMIHKSKISKLIKLGEIQDAKTIAILMMAECVL